MLSRKILDEDIRGLKISSLPTRPTTSSTLGGRGYSTKDMKEAFDKLSLYIIECFNRLIEDITCEPEGSIASSIRTGITDTHTLSELFSDILSGELANYMTVFGESLVNYLGKLREDVDSLKSAGV